MFTGLVEATARVEKNTENQIVLTRPQSFEDIKCGQSICTAGVCLTLIECADKTMTFDVMPETQKRTKIGYLKEGDQVNLERALKSGDRLGGHIVEGHVEGTGEVVNILETDEDGYLIKVSAPSELVAYISQQGSIALDGVSLTVARKETDTFTVALIPRTLKETTLSDLKPGDKVNLETDRRNKFAPFSH
jgi:riboflavin synthase